MAAKLETTGTAGVFRRHAKGCERTGRCECAYVTTWRANGRQHTETHRTLAEAREAKRTHETDSSRGEFAAATRTTLHEYALGWIDRYQGTGRRGFREETRADYRWNLERYALAYFPAGLKLRDVTPRMVADFIGWMVKEGPLGQAAVGLIREQRAQAAVGMLGNGAAGGADPPQPGRRRGAPPPAGR